MAKYHFGRVVLGLSLAFGACVAASSCGSDTKASKAVGCTLNSDCDSKLICVYQRCHQACKASSDCPEGERCVAGDSAAAPHVCQLPLESSCTGEASCSGDQVCTETDMQCRTPCQSTANCVKGDYCEGAGSQKVCFVATNSTDQSVLVADGVLEAGAPDSSLTGEGGSSGMIGPSGTAGAAGESTGGASSEDGGMDAGVCTVHFGAIAVGDSNPGYRSGAGTRTPKGILLLDGYGGPGVDGGLENRIDVQSFDVAGATKAAATTALSNPPAVPNSDFIKAATTSPGGITAVVYTEDDGYNPAPKIAFLAADLSLIGVPQSLGPNNSVVGQPDMQWVKDRFVIAFAYNDGSNLYAIKVQMFGPDGTMITGLGPVPTDDSAGHIYTPEIADLVSLAASGNTLAVLYRNAANAYPTMSLVDLDANPIGDPIQIVNARAAYGLAIGGTAGGFVAVWHEYQTMADAGADLFGSGVGHATFVSLEGKVGTSVRVPGGIEAYHARGSSDGTRAGFALLYPDGVRFGSAIDDLVGGFRTSSAIPAASGIDYSNDVISIVESAATGTFGISYYSYPDRLTRAVIEGCSPVTAN